jgi:hypothetical protein
MSVQAQEALRDFRATCDYRYFIIAGGRGLRAHVAWIPRGETRVDRADLCLTSINTGILRNPAFPQSERALTRRYFTLCVRV